MLDYLIIGQGLAGTVLADLLLKEGKSILVVDADQAQNSSRVAAGLYNPITGRKMVRTWIADQLFAGLEDYYSGLEKQLGKSFLVKRKIYRPFTGMDEVNQWMANTADPDYERYISQVHTKSLYPDALNDGFGGLELDCSGYLQVGVLLDAYRDRLRDGGAYHSGTFDCGDLEIDEDFIRWKAVEAREVIFCEGVGALKNPYIDWLPFSPVKGELLSLKMDYSFDHIVNRGGFMVEREPGVFRAGSTYNWRDPWSGVTTDGKKEILDKITPWLKIPFEIVHQESGVRPATKDRRPFLGSHPKYGNMSVFNGLGTKGVSLAPYFANQLVNYLVRKTELDQSVNISRFYSLY